MVVLWSMVVMVWRQALGDLLATTMHLPGVRLEETEQRRGSPGVAVLSAVYCGVAHLAWVLVVSLQSGWVDQRSA